MPRDHVKKSAKYYTQDIPIFYVKLMDVASNGGRKKGVKKLDSHQIVQSIQGQPTDDTLQKALRVALRVTYTSMSL